MTKIAVTFSLIFILGCSSEPTNKIPLANIDSDTAVKTVKINTPKPAIREEYKIVKKTNSIPGDIDTVAIKKMDEHLKGLAAFYSAMGGTLCDGKKCELTTALGLGKQGSEQHKNLIKKYFPNDKTAGEIVANDCFRSPSGSSVFSDYQYITITDLGDTVKVDYDLLVYSKSETTNVEGPDIYLYKNNEFLTITRNIDKPVKFKNEYGRD